MKKLISGIILGILSLVSPAYSQVIGASVGVPQTVFDAVDLTAAVGDSAYDYSLYIGTNGASALTWQTIYSVAPSTVTVLLKGSTDCSTYSTIDTSTNVNGEIRSVFGSWKCVLVSNSVVTGGAGKTLTTKFVYSTGRMVGSPSGVTSYTGGTFSGPILLQDGTAVAPSLAFVSNPNMGIYRKSNGVMGFSTSGVEFMSGSASGTVVFLVPIGLPATGNQIAAGGDAFMSRPSAATWQLGAIDAVSPITQTLQSQGVSAGTSDVAGSNFIVKPGIGRGLAVPGVITLSHSFVTTTGSTAQTQQSALVLCGTKTLSTTSATAQTIITVTTTTLSAGGLTLYYNVSATSASAADAATGSVHVSWNNVGGTVNSTMGTVINEVQSNSSGTLAATPTVTVATSVVSVKLTPTWVTIVPTAVRGSFYVVNHGMDPIVCQ